MKLYTEKEVREYAKRYHKEMKNWVDIPEFPKGIYLPEEEEIESLRSQFDKYSFENFKLGIDFILNKIKSQL